MEVIISEFGQAVLAILGGGSVIMMVWKMLDVASSF